MLDVTIIYLRPRETDKSPIVQENVTFSVQYCAFNPENVSEWMGFEFVISFSLAKLDKNAIIWIALRILEAQAIAGNFL